MSSVLQKTFVIASEGWRLSSLGLLMACKAGSQIPKLEGTFLKSNRCDHLDLGLTIGVLEETSR